jgi:superfamily II DNA/RNA helicase
VTETRRLAGQTPAGEAYARVVVVVATQVIEVGVDLDFVSVITDAAPLASLVQRVGRVNRRLEAGEAEVLVVHDASQERLDENTYAGVYNLELTRRFRQRAREAGRQARGRGPRAGRHRSPNRLPAPRRGQSPLRVPGEDQAGEGRAPSTRLLERA